MIELPLGWIAQKFILLNSFRSASIDPASSPEEMFELYSVPAFPTRKPELVRGAEIGSTKQLVSAGDVLICKINPRINRVWLVDEKDAARQIASSEWIGFRAPEHCALFYRYYYSSPAFREQLCTDLTGVGGSLTRAQPKRVDAFMVPVAPRGEQQRIADKLDTLLARVDVCRDRLTRVALLLKRFRQSALAAATSGRLTEDWREANPGLAVDASTLVAKRRQVSASARDAKLLQELIETTPPSGGDSEIPRGWLKACVGLVGVVSNGSTPSRDQAGYWGGTIPWVSSGEVRDAEIFQTRECISQAGFDHSSVRLLPVGTVLIAMIGEGKTRGQSALLSLAACINQNVAGVVVLSNYLESRYLWRWFQAQYETTRLQGNGTGPQALNCQRVREIPVNLPPLAEQREIVRRVETLLAFVDRLEARLARAQTAVDRLTPSLLAKAFRGELVPQDPNDGPASTLLARITAEKSAPALTSRPRSPRAGRPPRAPKETAAMTKSRQDDDVMGKPYLAGRLRRVGTPTSAEALFKLAELPVADFYKQLAWEVAQGHVKDNQTTLEPGYAAG